MWMGFPPNYLIGSMHHLRKVGKIWVMNKCIPLIGFRICGIFHNGSVGCKRNLVWLEYSVASNEDDISFGVWVQLTSR